MTAKQPSGAAKRKRKRERELATDDGAHDDKEFLDAVRRLGPPPEDPLEAIVWGNRLAALAAWSAAVGPQTLRAAARRRAVLDGVRALGLTNAKAVDKKLMLRIAERLGLKAKDADGDLEPAPEGATALRA